MILQIYTIIHTLISLAAIFTGPVVVFGMLAGDRLDGWTKWFLVTALATTITGFFSRFMVSPRPSVSASYRCRSSHLRFSRVTRSISQGRGAGSTLSAA
jgi:hypothetical protein